MSFQELLASRRKDILKKWQKKIFLLYPADSNKFLTSESDRFANPVGNSIKEKTENLLAELTGRDEFDPERAGAIMDEMIRIRAVQDFSPSEAVSFIYLLKDVITDELRNLPDPDKAVLAEALSFYGRIDKAAVTAFEIYVKCREKLFEIKVESAKNQVSGLLRRSDLISEAPEWESC